MNSFTTVRRHAAAPPSPGRAEVLPLSPRVDVPAGPGKQARAGSGTARKILLGCGIVSSLMYVALNFLGAWQYPGYSLASQTISELYAIGAPSKPLVTALMAGYGLLLYVFGVGVWLSAVRNRALRIAAVGMVAKEVLGMAVTLFFPMHQREVLAAGGATLSDEMHRDLTMAGTLFMLLALVSGAAAFGPRFRVYSIATIMTFIVGGVLAFGDAPRMAANLPTPWQGVTERALAFGYMLWIAVLAITLMRAPAERRPTRAVASDGTKQ